MNGNDFDLKTTMVCLYFSCYDTNTVNNFDPTTLKMSVAYLYENSRIWKRISKEIKTLLNSVCQTFSTCWIKNIHKMTRQFVWWWDFICIYMHSSATHQITIQTVKMAHDIYWEIQKTTWLIWESNYVKNYSCRLISFSITIKNEDQFKTIDAREYSLL